MTPRAATRPLPRAERRATILAGAARAFAAGGFDATSMEDIAEASGVTKLILYRHFESKEELYRDILQDVSGQLKRGTAGGSITQPFLVVAREHPDGFRLLWNHSSREPRFAAYAAAVHDAAVAFARRRLADRVDPALLDWAAPVSVDFLVEAVLRWLDHGDPSSDGRFLEAATHSLEALVSTWAP